MKLTRLSAAVAAAAMAPAVLFASPASAADGAEPPANSAPDKSSEAKPQAGDGEAAESAAKQDEDNRFAILRMLNGRPIGRGLEREANKALNGTPEDRRHFLEVGQYKARLEDDRVRVAQIMSRGGPAVQDAGSKALDDGGAEAVKEFLEKGQYAAQRIDDELRATQIMSAGGPAVKEAAEKALRGTYEDVKRFLETGQYEARKKDEAAEEAAKKKPAEGKKDAGQPSNGDGHRKDDAGRDAAKPAQDSGKSSAKAASVEDTPAAASAKGGEMASTGADASVPWALGGGAAAVAAGAGMVVVARRRRAAEQG
ncbi:ALF repeat-containing protein [Streptomyces morookaense]|uniref:ALF repeat-containing protein n=1 Tax=Streptomyces morookaense TaxID=1970 RepID=UPI0033C12F0A